MKKHINRWIKNIDKVLIIVAPITIVAICIAIFRPFTGSIDFPSEIQPASEFQTYDEQYRDLTKQAEQKLPQLRKQLAVPSLSMSVGFKGELVWSGVTGYKNIQNKMPAKLSTQYRIGSISKPLTTTALATLYDKSLIDLSAPIQSYLPNFPMKKYPINLKQLSGHLAGIRHYGFMYQSPFWELWLNQEYSNVQEGLSLFEDDSLIAQPDTEYNYSTFGYSLIAAAMEQARQKDFPTIVQESVLDPLKMSNTGIDSISSSEVGKATWYSKSLFGEEFKLGREINSSYKWAGGGYLSTPTDLIKLGNAWLQSTLFSKSTRDLFTSPQQLNNGKLNKELYAMGWRSQTIELENPTGEKVAHPVIFHDGKIEGGTTFLILFPESELVVAATVNSDIDNFMDLPRSCFKIAQLFLNQ